MSNRDVDDYIPPFAANERWVMPGEEMPPPQTVRAVIVDLRLEKAPEAEQRAAVEAWVEDNEPSPNLRWSLRRNGYTIPSKWAASNQAH
jgi:hypothetical protein